MPSVGEERAPSQVLDNGPRTPPLLLGVVGALTLLALMLSAPGLLFDTNFYTLWEATNVLAGDHPYRDFFEWGMPLQALASVIGQAASGGRLAGEFGLHWLAIIGGAVISAALGYRLSGSATATLLTASIPLMLIGATPTFHYPKLLCYPLGVWAAWSYLDRPSPRRAVLVGAVTAAAFLFRHDHGLYIGGLAVLTFIVARVNHQSTRSPASMIRDAAAFCAVSIALIGPWMVLVQSGEGVLPYVSARQEMYKEFSANAYPHRVLAAMSPFALFRRPPPPPPQPAEIVFRWEEVADARQRELETTLGLRRLSGPDEDRRIRYHAPNVLDTRFLQIRPITADVDGITWGELERLASWLPEQRAGEVFTMQMGSLLPILLLGAALISMTGARRRGRPIPLNTWRALLVSVFLIGIDIKLFRESGYVMVVAPLTAAVAAALITGLRTPGDDTTPGRSAARRRYRLVRLGAVVPLFTLTAIAAYARTESTALFDPHLPTLAETMNDLLTTPAVDGYAPRERIEQFTRAQWDAEELDVGLIVVRYMHDCTRDGDRILVSGSTPYHIGYYVGRPIAGGHLLWHHNWRSRPELDAQSLALVQRQPVPFAFSTHDPVLTDLQRYPQTRAYIQQHYAELPGTRGHLLYDTRRTPTGTFANLGLPCFK